MVRAGSGKVRDLMMSETDWTAEYWTELTPLIWRLEERAAALRAHIQALTPDEIVTAPLSEVEAARAEEALAQADAALVRAAAEMGLDLEAISAAAAAAYEAHIDAAMREVEDGGDAAGADGEPQSGHAP